MLLVAFRVQMYRSVIDSGWIIVDPLTVLVGKNESGKTTLLRALHKLNPFTPEPYSMDSEWPRGMRPQRTPSQVACTGRFRLNSSELDELATVIGRRPAEDAAIEIGRTYGGHLNFSFPPAFLSGRLRSDEIDTVLASSPPGPTETSGHSFRTAAQIAREEIQSLAERDDYDAIPAQAEPHALRLSHARSAEDSPERAAEDSYIASYAKHLKTVAAALRAHSTIQARVEQIVQKWVPTFIYMSDYRAFSGTAHLEQLQQRNKAGQLTEEDKTVLMVLKLSGLELDQEVRKGQHDNREQRQYDMDDASASLTKVISDRWKQRRYEVQFRADGYYFYTFVKDERDPSLIRLEERSKGFQWFFSFDLMFMHETGGTFKNCVLLLDEPGLHLHPDAQRDLLKRLEAYAEGNTLIYTTHLPFMIDLRQPSRLRVLSESDQGVVVTDDLTRSQPEAKLVLQAALGMSGSASHLVAERNLVVEGVDDFWILTEISNLLIRSGRRGLPDDVLITPAGGASEAAYIATFMIGQRLNVVVLLDTDRAGDRARDALVKSWLTRYHGNHAHVLSLGPAAGEATRDFAIEDLFPDDYYVAAVKEVYERQLTLTGTTELQLVGTGMLSKRVERALNALQIKFNKGSVAKLVRGRLSRLKSLSDLPPVTQERGEAVIAAIRQAFDA